MMAKFRCVDRFITMVRQLHNGIKAHLQADGEKSDAFPVTKGVNKGCTVATAFFSIIFSAMLTDAFSNSEEGILIRYRKDGKFFNRRRLLAVTKVKETVVKYFFSLLYQCYQ